MKPHLKTQNSTEKTATNVPKWKVTRLVNEPWKDPTPILPCQEVAIGLFPPPQDRRWRETFFRAFQTGPGFGALRKHSIARFLGPTSRRF